MSDSLDAAFDSPAIRNEVRKLNDPHRKSPEKWIVRIAAGIAAIAGGVWGTAMKVGQTEQTTQMAVISVNLANLAAKFDEFKTDNKVRMDKFDERLREVEKNGK